MSVPNCTAEDRPVPFAKAAILQWLDNHPQAADTTEGIHQWWIAWPSCPAALAVTETALLQLEQARQIECVRLGNRDIWRRPRST